MPIARFQLEDGRIARFEVPEGTTPEQAQQMMSSYVQQNNSTSAQQAIRTPEPASNPTEGMTGYEKFMSGAGKSVADMGRGIKQLGAIAGNKVGLVSDQTVQNIQSDIDESKKLDAPLMNTKAGVAGNISGTIATTLLPAGGLAKAGGMTGAVGRTIINPQTYKAAAAVGAIQGALQPVASDESRVTNAAIGAAGGTVGLGLANAVGRLAKPVQVAIDPVRKRAVQILKDAGVSLDAAQQTGSKKLEQIKRFLSDNPVTQGGQAAAIDQQKKEFTGAVLNKAFGVTGDVADEATMASVRDQSSKLFNEALDGVSIRLSQSAKNQLGVLAQRSKRQLGENNQIVTTINDLLSQAQTNGGKIDGKFYHVLRQDLGALQSTPNVSPLATEMLNGLDNAFQQSAGGAKAEQFKQARRLWRNMKIVESSIDETGNISAPKLANTFGTKRNRLAGTYGKGDSSVVELAKLAKAGKAVLQDKYPNSGTASRAAAQVMLPAAIGGGIGYAQEGDLSGAAKYAGGAVLAPMAIQSALKNGMVKNYLTSGIGNVNALINNTGRAVVPAAALTNALQQ